MGFVDSAKPRVEPAMSLGRSCDEGHDAEEVGG